MQTRLAQEVLRTHYRLLDFRAKTAQDARQFLFWRFGGSANDRSVQLEPQVCLKTAQDPGQFVFWRFGGCVSDRICTVRTRNAWKTTHDARQFVLECFLALFGFKVHLLGLEVNQLRALKGVFFLPGSRLVPPLRIHNECVSIYSAKTTQDARQFVFGVFL